MTIFDAMGAVIREARESRKLNQTELAQPLGWKQKKISLIESGKQPVHLGEIEQIAEVLGKDPVAMIAEAFKRHRAPKSA
jgi:transcriptional regulator with XRE-family HTH domain